MSTTRPLKQDESVARLVPKRNIETWTLCLNAGTVDEETDYTPAHYIDSLRLGIKELKQLKS